MTKSENIKCPKCGGVANKMWLIKATRNKAFFVVECWSGNLGKDSPHHLFHQEVRLAKAQTVEYSYKTSEADGS